MRIFKDLHLSPSHVLALVGVLQVHTKKCDVKSISETPAFHLSKVSEPITTAWWQKSGLDFQGGTSFEQASKDVSSFLHFLLFYQPIIFLGVCEDDDNSE